MVMRHLLVVLCIMVSCSSHMWCDTSCYGGDGEVNGKIYNKIFHTGKSLPSINQGRPNATGKLEVLKVNQCKL